MYKAEISIVLFKMIGIWPSESTKGFLTIYDFYTIFTVSIILVFAVTNSFYILSENFDRDELTENFFYSIATFIDCVKMLVIYQKRSKIRQIEKCLNNKQFKPRDSEEFFIQNKFDKIGRFLF